MTSLKDLILKRAEFDTDKTENESAHFRLDHPTMPAAQMFFEGVYWKHKKLRPLITALAEIVEAVEASVKAWGDYAPNPNSKAARVLRDSKAALTKLDELLKAKGAEE